MSKKNGSETHGTQSPAQAEQSATADQTATAATAEQTAQAERVKYDAEHDTTAKAVREAEAELRAAVGLRNEDPMYVVCNKAAAEIKRLRTDYAELNVKASDS